MQLAIDYIGVLIGFEAIIVQYVVKRRLFFIRTVVAEVVFAVRIATSIYNNNTWPWVSFVKYVSLESLL